MLQNDQMEQGVFYPVHSGIKYGIEGYLVVHSLLQELVHTVLGQIERKELLTNIPPYATLQSNRITDTLIRKDLIQHAHLNVTEFYTLDQEPQVNIKEGWMSYATKTTSLLNNRINGTQSPSLLTPSHSMIKYPSSLPPFTKNQFSNYSNSLNLQTLHRDTQQQDILRRKKRDQQKKARNRDTRKNTFRKGVKYTEDDTDLTSVKPKEKKSYKFIYDDQGRKIFISQVDKHHSPEEIQMTFEVEKGKGTGAENKKKLEKVSMYQQPILKTRGGMGLGISTYEMNRVDNSPFGRNFIQNPYRQTLGAVEEQKSKKGKRNSFNLFQETQTFLNREFELDKKENRNSLVPELLKQFNRENKDEGLMSRPESKLPATSAKRSRIKIFNQQLLRRIIHIQQQKNKAPLLKPVSEISIKLSPPFHRS